LAPRSAQAGSEKTADGPGTTTALGKDLRARFPLVGSAQEWAGTRRGEKKGPLGAWFVPVLHRNAGRARICSTHPAAADSGGKGGEQPEPAAGPPRLAQTGRKVPWAARSPFSDPRAPFSGKPLGGPDSIITQAGKAAILGVGKKSKKRPPVVVWREGERAENRFSRVSPPAAVLRQLD